MPPHVRLRPGAHLIDTPVSEALPDGWTWWRLARSEWVDPLDPTFAQRHGGRWNPPRSFPVLYLNEDVVTARFNLRAFIAPWPFEPEDLNEHSAPRLVGATLPRDQNVCDAHTPAGIRALGLPSRYPYARKNALVPHATCQPLGETIKAAGLKGVRSRSAQTEHGAGRELAWFPATRRSRAQPVERLDFAQWYWG